MVRKSIIPETWNAAEQLAKQTGIPVERHYEALIDMFQRPSIVERVAWHFRGRYWHSLLKEALLVALVIVGLVLAFRSLRES